MYKQAITKQFLTLFIFLTLTIEWSCYTNVTDKNSSILSASDSSLHIRYAQGFKILYINNCKIIEIYNPKKTDELYYTYIVYRDTFPDLLVNKSACTLVKIPLQSVVCLSTTHLAFLDKLNQLEVVTGIANVNQVNNTEIQKRVEKGLITAIGEADQIQFEKLALLKPDLIFTYEIPGSTSTASSLVNKLKIPQASISEFLETHPLGQFEWIKFFAAFFEKEKIAAQIFDSICNEYQMLQSLAKPVKNKPNVITSLPWKGQWHLASGNSLLTKYIEDAGGAYVMKDIGSDGNLVLPIEAVYEKALHADYWINVGIANSKQDVINTDQRLSQITALKTGNIYNNTLQCNEDGWSDYYESGVVNPHNILKDMIKIMHPELLPDYPLHYYKKLE